MEWFAWLSKTNLEPALVYEYGVAFAQNELEQDDISYLNHEFLQSMGISIAKHRLEILKLARKHTVPKLLIAIKRCFSRYLLPRRQEYKNNRAPLLLTNGGGRDHEYWSSAVEEIRWDTMFQNLKPT